MTNIWWETTGVKLNFTYKALFPNRRRKSPVVEDIVIPLFPNALGCYQKKKFHEVGNAQLLFHLNKPMKYVPLS